MLGCESDPNSRQRNFRRAALYAALIGILLAPSLSQAVEYTAARKAGRDLAARSTRSLEVPGHLVAESRKIATALAIAHGSTFGFGKGLAQVRGGG